MESQEIKPFFRPDGGSPVPIAVCMSGVGSNAEVLMCKAACSGVGFRVAVIFTDAPESSAASALGAKYRIPVESLDIRRFYAENGEGDIRLTTVKRRELRRQWSGKVWELLRPYNVGFAVFAGFVPLNQLPEKLLCLNVHPGDLTVESPAGVRRYAGLHCRPVEMAILDGNPALRSSVILVQSTKGNGRPDVDAGPVLGISGPVPVELSGSSVEELKQIDAARKTAPYRDRLRQLAKLNVEKLKRDGDHRVLPAVVAAFAAGRYGVTANGELAFRTASGQWVTVGTVEFASDGTESPRRTENKTKRSAIVRYFRWLYLKVVRTDGSPDYAARGWALGMFVGCTIPVFFQLIIAVPLSFVFRGSKVGAALGPFITTPPTAVFIYPVQIWVGSRIVGGGLSYQYITEQVPQMLSSWRVFFNVGRELVVAFFAGGLLWAAIMTPLTYFLVRFLVIRYRRIRNAILESRRKRTEA